jgi:hypothetical protein
VITLKAQPLNKACFPTTHNSFNVAKGKKHFIFPNHTYPITRQLEDSIRGFMLDVYERKGEVYLYHAYAALGKQRLSIVLEDYKKWLLDHPNELVVIIFQNAITKGWLFEEFKKLEMESMLVEINWEEKPFPTIQEINARKQQILAFVEGDDKDFVPRIYPAWRHIFDTPWQIKPHQGFPNTIGRGRLTHPLFLLNHWVDRLAPRKKDAIQFNDFDFLKQRVLDCKAQLDRWPNLIGINFHEKGKVVKVCQWVQEEMKKENE